MSTLNNLLTLLERHNAYTLPMYTTPEERSFKNIITSPRLQQILSDRVKAENIENQDILTPLRYYMGNKRFEDTLKKMKNKPANWMGSAPKLYGTGDFIYNTATNPLSWLVMSPFLGSSLGKGVGALGAFGLNYLMGRNQNQEGDGDADIV